MGAGLLAAGGEALMVDRNDCGLKRLAAEDTASAGRQPPISDRYLARDCLPDTHTWERIPGTLGARQCVRCGLITDLPHAPRVLAGDDLPRVILALLPHVVGDGTIWHDIVYFTQLEQLDEPQDERDPTWRQLRDARVAELAKRIDHIDLGGA